MAKSARAYGIGSPFQNVFPKPLVAQRAPLTTDVGYEVGQQWIDQPSDQAYILTSVAGGSATWALSSPGSSDVDTLTGDSGGAISPSGGTITLAGGTNITTAGSGSTITANLDAAISVATSVTSPLYTAGAGVDLDVTVPSGQDGVIKMGDAAGSNKVSFTDSADAEVASIDSDGAASFAGDLALSSVATKISMNGGAATDFIGQATLVSGTVTVANTNIAANDRIFVFRADPNSSSALGILAVTAQTPSTSFIITALDPADGSTTITGDVSVVNYIIFRQT